MYCITNDMPDVRSCTIRDVHQIICDGNQYRWNSKTERFETTGRQCKGCLPRESRHGLLCWGCWENVETAIDGYQKLTRMLAGVDRAVQRDNGGVRGQSLGYVPIASVPLMLDELESYVKGRPSNADVWVSTSAGAMNAVRFGRAFAAAMRSHPTEETAHRIRRTRCTKCRQLTLVWHPAPAFRSNVTVKCSNPDCGLEMDQTSFEAIAAIEKPEKKVAA